MSVFQIDPDTDEIKGFSFSGNERNRFFANVAGSFEDQTLQSGIDFLEDGRGFVLCDLDKDGVLELGIVSAQGPRFRIASKQRAKGDRSFVSVKLVGGNQKAVSDESLSPRDPVGTILVARTGSESRMFQLSSGEGFSVQNSREVFIGLGNFGQIDKLEVRWPSGRISVRKDILAGTRIEITETGS